MRARYLRAVYVAIWLFFDCSLFCRYLIFFAFYRRDYYDIATSHAYTLFYAATIFIFQRREIDVARASFTLYAMPRDALPWLMPLLFFADAACSIMLLPWFRWRSFFFLLFTPFRPAPCYADATDAACPPDFADIPLLFSHVCHHFADISYDICRRVILRCRLFSLSARHAAAYYVCAAAGTMLTFMLSRYVVDGRRCRHACFFMLPLRAFSVVLSLFCLYACCHVFLPTIIR